MILFLVAGDSICTDLLLRTRRCVVKTYKTFPFYYYLFTHSITNSISVIKGNFVLSDCRFLLFAETTGGLRVKLNLRTNERTRKSQYWR